MANSNRRRSSIDSLLIDGTISTNRSEISEHIVQFYRKLFIEQFSWRLMVDNLSFASIDEVAACWLERDFEEKELWEVVKLMDCDKASGLDCYSMAFIQACWVVLKDNIMKVFCEFHASGKFERSLNAKFLTPILKIPKAV